MVNVQISQNEYSQLQFYKKLVENNFQEEVDSDELKLILGARHGRILTEKEFLDKHPDLRSV